MMAAPHAPLARLLDEEFEQLQTLENNAMTVVVPSTIDRLATQTRAISHNMDRREWLDIVQSQIDPHPIVKLLEQDPYTARARSKPRGYAGDAVMMDYCYFTTPPESTSELGRAIFFSTTTSPNGRSVLARLGTIASHIDRLAEKVEQPNVLALACGHLREAVLSPAFRNGRIGRLIALDQDEASLAVVKARYSSYQVECVSAKIKSILTGELVFTDLDFVYAAGLFDYLDDNAARQLVAQAFGFLKPGGQLLIGNFLPDTYGRGYMEAFMKWLLIARTRKEIIGLADLIDHSLIESMSYFQDEYAIIGYLVLTKR
jgi:SAM-dependent methyltransferase